MDGAYRQSTPDIDPKLLSTLEADAPKFAFFQAVELILGELGHEVEERALQEQGVENLMFRVDPGMGFPAGDLVKVEELENTDGDRSVAMTVNFLGLHGASSPLPPHMLETAVWSQGEEGVQQSFNDFFSNRLIWLFYLSWRKYRYFIRYRPGATDQFSDWMFSLIGIGGKEARGAAGIPWAKLLTYLGIVAGRTRSAEMIAGVIAHSFALPNVWIRQVEHRLVTIPEDQRSKMGMANMTLGHDMTIGDHVKDVAGKFTIVFEDLSFRRFRDFLPSGRDYPRLKELVEFLLKDQLAYDLELHFQQDQTPEFTLGEEAKSDLGWTTFSGDGGGQELKPVVLQMRA